MNNKIKKLLRGTLLTAIASFISTDANAESGNAKLGLDNLNNDALDELLSKTRSNTIYKNVLKVRKNGEVDLIAGHRSHMSHRSGGGGGYGGGHRSHSSHYSSYGGGHSSHSSHSSSSYSGGSYRRSSGTTSSSYSAPKPSYQTYSLGDRTLKSGHYGSDVDALTTLLVSKKYMRSSWTTTQNGYSVYNPRVVAAVKHFQKDAGLPQTGVLSSTDASRLQSWSESNTTIELGVRDLTYSSNLPMTGTDVANLITLLNAAGFPPNPKKIVMSNGKAEYTADIAMAVKLFQAYNGLSATGTADETTIEKLKTCAK